MLTMGQTLQAIRGLEMLAGSALYRAKKVEDPAKALGIALGALEEIQKGLERLED